MSGEKNEVWTQHALHLQGKAARAALALELQLMDAQLGAGSQPLPPKKGKPTTGEGVQRRVVARRAPAVISIRLHGHGGRRKAVSRP